MAQATLHPYAAFAQNVLKPARYLGGEYQSVTKPRDSVDIRICLAFPEIYDIGMSHLGTKILYSILNKHPRIACERAFTPWVDMEAELRTRKLSILSLESATPLADFDVVGMSLQYEMTFTNALNMLDLSHIPRRAADRREHHPLIIAGGPTATHCEPVAPFFDAVLVGDAEEALPLALLAIAEWKRAGLDRATLLSRLAHEHVGWYVPALYDRVIDERSGLMVVDKTTARGPYPVKRAVVLDINRFPFPDDSPVAAAEAIFDRVSIEIARGCTEGCRFCQAGMIYRPVRERDPDQIVDTIMKALDKGGYDEASLTSLSTADYSCVSPLIKKVMGKMRERKASLSVSSLRAYGLDEDLLDEISSVKATGLTFAPEAGTQRMRDVINKNISEENLMETADRVFSRGWQRMKFYFMIGPPTETDEDVRGIIETAARARAIGWKHHPKSKVSVTASVSSLVPKPHTPFQWAAMDTIADIDRKQKILRDLGRQLNISTKWHNYRESYVEGIFSRGDIRCADLLEAALDAGCRLDSWDEHLKWDTWLEVIAAWGVDPALFLGTLPVDGGLPWDHLDVGLEDGFLAQEWKRATKNRLSPPCGKPKGMQVHHTNIADANADQRKLVCYNCGIACDLTQMRTERVDYLGKLGALTADDVRAAADFVPGYQQLRKDRVGRSLPPLRAQQNESFRYRVIFTKLGTIAVTSHLDLARNLPRIIRRAGLTQKYSSGFSPHALVSYGPALPLGVLSVGEACDLYLHEEMSADELVAQLEAVTDPGLHFLGAGRTGIHAPALAKVAKVGEYILHVPDATLAELHAAVARACAAEPLMVEGMRKAGMKRFDVRDGLIGLKVDLPTSLEQQLLPLPRNPGPVLRWTVDLVAGAHVRPTELALGIFGREANALLTARTGLFGLHAGEVVGILDPRVTVSAAAAAFAADSSEDDTAPVIDLADTYAA